MTTSSGKLTREYWYKLILIISINHEEIEWFCWVFCPLFRTKTSFLLWRVYYVTSSPFFYVYRSLWQYRFIHCKPSVVNFLLGVTWVLLKFRRGNLTPSLPYLSSIDSIFDGFRGRWWTLSECLWVKRESMSSFVTNVLIFFVKILSNCTLERMYSSRSPLLYCKSIYVVPGSFCLWGRDCSYLIL